MTNSRQPQSAPPAMAQSGMGRKAGMALQSSPGASSRRVPAAVYPAIPTMRTAATSKRRSAARSSDVSICRTAIPRRDAGLRIDHLLLSPSVAARLVAAEVDRDVRSRERASDHAPVWIELAEANAESPPQVQRPRND